MFLYIARHAWAGHFGDVPISRDSQRALTVEGVERYRRMIQALSDRGMTPSQVATSPYVRCRQTADILAEPSGGRVVDCSALEPGSDFEAMIEWSRQFEGQDIAWVGHNPDVQHFVAQLVGHGAARIRFAKGSIAAVRFEDRVEPGAGQLYWHATAKMLGID